MLSEVPLPSSREVVIHDDRLDRVVAEQSTDEVAPDETCSPPRTPASPSGSLSYRGLPFCRIAGQGRVGDEEVPYHRA